MQPEQPGYSNGYPNGYPAPQTHQPYPARPGYPGYPVPGQIGVAPGYGPPNMTLQTTRPGTVTAASIMWIIYGGLALIGNLMALANVKPGSSTVIGLCLAIGFLIAGIQGLTGKAKSMLPMGITSIVLGGLVAIAMLALGSLLKLHAGFGVLALIGLLLGGYLIVSGILACVGNAKFKAWRASRGMY